MSIAVGGHVQKIKFKGQDDSTVLIKDTHRSELDFYTEVFKNDAPQNLIDVRRFIPKFYGEHGQASQASSNKYAQILLENITKDLKAEFLTAIDVKLGTSTVTMRCRKSQQDKAESSQQQRSMKDLKTTTAKYGFIISGYEVRDPQDGKLLDKFYKYPYKNRQQSANSIRSIFLKKPQQSAELNVSAIKHSLTFLNDLKDFVAKKGNWPYDVKGSSILIAVNHNKRSNNCAIKLIDFASVEKMDMDYVDEGLITGIESLITILEELLNPVDQFKCNKQAIDSQSNPQISDIDVIGSETK